MRMKIELCGKPLFLKFPLTVVIFALNRNTGHNIRLPLTVNSHGYSRNSATSLAWPHPLDRRPKNV